MDTKLTLKLDSSVIENAKVYAKMKKVSLSQLIEAYLNVLTGPKDQQDVTPLVKSLSGVVKLPDNYDYKKEYQKHLSGKYSK
jgi:predicted ATP-dependent Lon-type protease